MKIFVLLSCALFLSIEMIAQDVVAKEKLASVYFEKGVASRTIQQDSSYYYFENSFKYFYQSEQYSDALDAVSEALITSSDYYDLERYLIYVEQIEDLLSQNTIRSSLVASGDFTYYQNVLLYDQASFYYKLKDYSQAKTNAMQLWLKFNKNKVSELDTYDFAYLLSSTHILAAIAMNTGKYDLAENYFNQALDFTDRNETGKARRSDRGTKRLLSQLYIQTGKYKKAGILLSELLDDYKLLFTNDREYKNSLITVYQRTVNNLVQQDSLQKAIFYLNESQEYLLPDDPFFKQSLLLYGTIYVAQNQDQKALLSYQDALKAFQKFRHNKPHQDIAEVHGKIAELYLKQKYYLEGLKIIQQAFNAAGSKIKISNDLENPNPELVFSKTQLLHLLDIKLQLLDGLYKSTSKKKYLDFAIQTERDLLKTFDQLKTEFDSKLDKQFLVENAYPTFERMLEIIYTAFEKNKSNKLLELALNIGEKSKDFTLMGSTSKYPGDPIRQCA